MRAPAARAHPPAHGGRAAPRHRAGDGRRPDALPLAGRACGGAPAPRARRRAPRVIEQLQGFELAAGAWETRGAARARPRLRAGVARRALPLGRGGVGAARAARQRR